MGSARVCGSGYIASRNRTLSALRQTESGAESRASQGLGVAGRAGMAFPKRRRLRRRPPAALHPEDERMTERKKRVLIADDQPDVVEALRLLLKGESFETDTAASPAGVLEAVETSDFDVVLMDLN